MGGGAGAAPGGRPPRPLTAPAPCPQGALGGGGAGAPAAAELLVGGAPRRPLRLPAGGHPARGRPGPAPGAGQGGAEGAGGQVRLARARPPAPGAQWALWGAASGAQRRQTGRVQAPVPMLLDAGCLRADGEQTCSRCWSVSRSAAALRWGPGWPRGGGGRFSGPAAFLPRGGEAITPLTS